MLRDRLEAVGGYDETLQIGEDTDLLLRMAGNPVVIPYGDPNLFVGHQIDAVSGYHGCGPWQTTTMGHQSSAADDRNFFEVKAEFERQQSEHSLAADYAFTFEDRPEWITPEHWDLLWRLAHQKLNDTSVFNITAQV